MKIDQQFIDDLLLKIKAGVEVEQDKFELKSEWYKLSTSNGCEELCKDISAIANTASYDDGMIVIGIDKKNAKLINSPFAKSGINDASVLRSIVVKRVDTPPDYTLEEITVEDGKGSNVVLSVIRIHPSYTKPHILKIYKNSQNYIPIKKGTSINSANRTDLEIMFYDRTKIEPENRIEINVYSAKLAFNRIALGETQSILAHAFIVLDNSGRRPASINDARIKLSYITDREIVEYFDGYQWIINNAIDPIGGERGNFPAPILLGPNKTLTCTLKFRKQLNTTEQRIARNELDQYRKIKSYEYQVFISTISQGEFPSAVFRVSE